MSGLGRMAVLLLAGALPLAAQQTAPAKPAPQKKVWTNEDLEALRGTSPVSVVGQPPSAAVPLRKIVAGGERYVKEKDPEWYRDQLSVLRTDVRRIDDEIEHIRQTRLSPRNAPGGLILGQMYGIPLHPDNQIANLERRKREVLQKILDLEELARRNEIPPGEIR